VSKKPIIGGIILVIIIGVVYAGAQINPDNPENEKSPNSEVWSTRIVGAEISSGGGVGVMTNLAGDTHTYSTIELERNVPYKFGFVPMGSSPNWIKISLSCKGLYPLNDAADCDVNFSELFILEGILIDTGISEYYTWDYTGNKNFEISTKQCPHQKTCGYNIIVQRAGMSGLEGSVTISLSR
jgi:hypothetical protein